MLVCRNGRRGRLKICCGQPRVGSSPTTSIDEKSENLDKMRVSDFYLFIVFISLAIKFIDGNLRMKYMDKLLI